MDSDSIQKLVFLEFTCHHDEWPLPDKNAYEQIILKTLAITKWTRPIAISVLFEKDSSVKELNQTYRNQDKPTNVLSFAGYDEQLLQILPSSEMIPLGDIIFALETIQSEAESQQKPFQNHLTHLFVHGLLHLLGFDHETESDAEAMEDLEINILSTLLIPNPYEVI